MAKVVIAYNTFSNVDVERGILDSIGAEVIFAGNLDTLEALEAARTADALMVTIQPVTASIIATLENCRIISRVGTGIDAIDVAAAAQRGIWVTNVADYSVDEVATHTMMMLLVYARRFLPMLESVKRGTWWNPQMIEPAYRLTGRVLGLLGFGRIGQAVATKASGFGFEIIAHDPFIDTKSAAYNGVRFVDFDTLLRESDYLSLHTPLSDLTWGIINADALAKMKPDALLINAARGELVDEDALLQAARSGKIGGAALDVIIGEPPPPDHPLLNEERIIVTPHAAWYSEQAKHDVRVRSAEEVVRVLRGERPLSPVNEIE